MTKYQLYQLLTKQIQYGRARWPDRPKLGQKERSIDLEINWYAAIQTGMRPEHEAGFHANLRQICPVLRQSEIKEVINVDRWNGCLLSSARRRARTNLSEITAQNLLMPLRLAGTVLALRGSVGPALLSVTEHLLEQSQKKKKQRLAYRRK